MRGVWWVSNRARRRNSQSGGVWIEQPKGWTPTGADEDDDEEKEED